MDTVKILGSLLSNNALGSQSGQNILESLLGSSGGGNQNNAANILSSLLGGGKRTGKNAGLGVLGALIGVAAQNQKKGGSGMDMLGELLGGQSSGGSGGLGDLMGGLLGGGSSKSSGGLLGGLLGAAGDKGGAGDLLGGLLGSKPGPVEAPPQEAHDEAEILIEAMCNAAKVDGRVDDSEKQNILAKLGDLEPDEIDFIKAQLSSPLDLNAFLSEVPEDMAQQVYAFSLMAVKLDSQAEAEYFAKLAGGLGIDGDEANQIHEQMGEPEIFA